MHNFRKLDIWIDSVELADTVYVMTDAFPKSEVYGLASQMQRAAVSVPSNIAEGSGKDSDRDFSRFLAIPLVCRLNYHLSGIESDVVPER